MGAGCRVLFGAVLTAEGGPVELGEGGIVMENAVLRGTRRDPLVLGRRVLVGPTSYLTGCRVEDEVFLATGTRVFNGARIGTRSEVRINGIVHLRTVLPADSTVPIGWVAVGDPVRILPPEDHDGIWAVQRDLDFPRLRLRPGSPGRRREPDAALSARFGRGLGRHGDDRRI
ncbi:gamma carbonic anhydrase family protein [Streptomyces exfoliatus]|uniref:Gamma carbonic anhydrase family protein n=1 Tax=Streptomyces exfoliatus TaxID=1905 RepID=A0ABV3D1L5_STREX